MKHDQILISIISYFMNCVIDCVETNTNLNKNDFRITNNLRKRIMDTIWTIIYYNQRGGKKFIEQQKAIGRKPNEYTGVRPCREKSIVIQTSVNELIDNEELYNQFIDIRTKADDKEIEIWFNTNLSCFEAQAKKISKIEATVEGLAYDDYSSNAVDVNDNVNPVVSFL